MSILNQHPSHVAGVPLSTHLGLASEPSAPLLRQNAETLQTAAPELKHNLSRSKRE